MRIESCGEDTYHNQLTELQCCAILVQFGHPYKEINLIATKFVEKKIIIKGLGFVGLFMLHISSF